MGMFDEQVSRKPNKYPLTDTLISAIHKSHWTKDEFNFSPDRSQFYTELTEQEQGIIVRTLSAIGQIEIAVKTFWARLGDNLPHPSLADLGFTMASNEVIHNQAYEHLINVLDLDHVFEENLKEPEIRGRVQYLRKYAKRVYEDDRKQYVYAIILFTLFVEYVSLFSQFYVAMHFNRHRGGILKSVAQQIEYTRKEETLHADIGIWIINTLRQEYPDLFDRELEARVQEECREAFLAESKVIDWIVRDYEDENLSAMLLKRYVAQRLESGLEKAGFDAAGARLNIPNDSALDARIAWADEEEVGREDTDFFNKRPVDYAKHHRAFSPDQLFRPEDDRARQTDIDDHVQDARPRNLWM